MDNETRELLTIALLRLDPRIADKRSALCCLLVEVALYDSTSGCSAEEIGEKIDWILGQKKALTQEEFGRALEQCAQTTVLVVDGPRYLLRDEKRSALRDAQSDTETKVSRVRTALVRRMELEAGELVPVEVEERIYDEVIKVIVEEIYCDSLELARQSLTLEQMVARIEASEPLARIEAFLKAHTAEDRQLLRKQLLAGVVEYLRELPAELRDLLGILHQNLVVSQILNLDPSLVNIQRQCFGRRRLYLDTNAVLSFMCEGQPSHQAVKEVLGASLNLGVQLFISPFTLAELERQVDRAKKDFHIYERDGLAKVLAPYSDDAIFATFIQLKHMQPALDWNGFIAPFEKFADLLLQQGILLEEEGANKVPGYGILPKIKQTIAGAKPAWAAEGVVEHDAWNCVLICILREKYKPDEMGQIVWLLTIDRSLKRSQRSLLGAEDLQNPYCMQMDAWGEIVLPIQNIQGFVFDDFMTYLAQARLGALADPGAVQFDFLETVRNAELDVDRLKELQPQQVREVMVKLQNSREIRKAIGEAAKAPDDATRAALQLELNPLLEKAIEDSDPVKRVEDEYSRRLTIMDQRVALMDQRAAQQDEQTAKQAGEIKLLNERLRQYEVNPLHKLIEWLKRIFGL